MRLPPLLFLLACLSSTSSLALDYSPGLGDVQANVRGEMPDYTIARENTKNSTKYPYIRAVEPSIPTLSLAFEAQIYDADNQLSLDLYTPRSNGPHPLMLLIHGGAWRSGDRSHMVPVAKYLADHGIAAAAIEYRTSRRALYPAGMLDIENALGYLRRHAEKWHIDAARVGLLGASSGAHMATLLGHRLNHQLQQRDISAVINFDGIVETVSEEVRRHENKPDKVSYLALWLGGRPNTADMLWREVSPLAYTDQYAPATYFVNSSQPRFHAGRDQMLTELQRFGIANGYSEIPDTPHAFWLFHPWFDDAMARTLAFLSDLWQLPNANQPHTDSHELDRLQINQLPPEEIQAWRDYFELSDRLIFEDQRYLLSELEQQTLNSPIPAPQLKDRNLYTKTQPNALNLINLLSFQTSSGGWAKNTDFLTAPRHAGQQFGVEISYVPTLDNDASTAQVNFLLRALAQPLATTLRSHVIESLQRAVDWLLQAQFPSGGWPQSFPLRGGYHNWSTYNDAVTSNVMSLLLDLQKAEYAHWLREDQRRAIGRAIQTSVQSIIYEQRWLDDDRGAWGQQHDPLSGELRPARAFEMAALCSMESAELLRVLMRLPKGNVDLEKAIRGGIAWLKSIQINNTQWRRQPAKASDLISVEGAPPLWPRFIDETSGRAIFGDRDGQIYGNVQDISIERQNGYAWYHNAPAKALEDYEKWLKH